ncbi:TSC22 domain family protein 2 [Trichechus inunguis]
MSKMPAKKKSCFQITSVTTAQVATSITEDTESLDDPDESRTEDVSSEIFDVSRATDYGPEEVCERSSSEETLNNVGDAETPGAVSPNLLLDGQLAAAAAAPANGGGPAPTRSAAGAPAAPAPPAPAASSATAAPPPPAACSSRFRVIKLDHGSGEPFRRGRWTCMEYYERDSDSSVLTRSGDCIRHSSTLEPTAERDSGLGATGGSVVVVVAAMQGAPGPDAAADSSLTAVSQLPPPEKPSQPAPGQPPPPPPGQTAGPGAPGLPPQFAYAPPPPAHLLPGPPSGPSDYLPPPPPPHVAGLPPPSPAPAPGPPAAAVGAQQLLGAAAPPGEAPGPPAAAAQAAGGGVVPPGLGLPAPPPPLGGPGPATVVPGGPHALVPGVPNVPAAVPAPSVPSVSSTSAPMPNVPAPLGQPPGSRSAGGVPHVGLPLAPGPPSAPTSLPQADLSQFQTQSQPAVGPVDDSRRKSEPLPQAPLSLIAETKPAVKAAGPDALANPLQLAPMNSLATSVFSIAIPVDGDEDRNPSTAFYQAFHLNTFQESKNLWDSASGGGVVAIDNKIEQAMDLVKSHLMYAVREEVEVLKEQIKELVERNSLLERENALLKSLSNSDQLSQLPAQQANLGSTSQQPAVIAQPPQPTQPPQQPNVSSA